MIDGRGIFALILFGTIMAGILFGFTYVIQQFFVNIKKNGFFYAFFHLVFLHPIYIGGVWFVLAGIAEGFKPDDWNELHPLYTNAAGEVTRQAFDPTGFWSFFDWSLQHGFVCWLWIGLLLGGLGWILFIINSIFFGGRVVTEYLKSHIDK